MLIVWAIFGQSCKNEWNDHYKTTSEVLNESITEYIQSQSGLSTFYQMLKISGYDTVLKASQSYTVWAPDNNALQNIDLTDTSEVSDIVKNHIAHFSYTTSGVQSEYIKMVNGKLIHFYFDNSEYKLANCTLTKFNVLVNNGIVHTINNYIQFQSNIWEFISRTQGLDSLRSYVNSLNYDSGYIKSNVLLDKIGALNNEDSIYTCILPDNTAWNEAYNRIKNYYIPYGNMTANDQRKYTQFSMVKDMAFRNRVSSPNTMDSLVSTFGNVFYQPGNLFNNTSEQDVSNGLVYVTSQLQYKDTASWHKEIRVEAENKDLWYKVSNANNYIYNSYGSSLNVSGKSYILVDPTATSSLSLIYVDFLIPGTLSAKYNIYCVFVPGTVLSTSKPSYFRPNRATFSINYSGINKSLPVTNNVTDPSGMTKMLVASNFTFPYCDKSIDGKSTPNVRLRVQDAVSLKDTATYNRAMLIDCIILEPVAQ